MADLRLDSTVILNNKKKIPRLGLGTYLATGNEGYKAIKTGLEKGYRHIDTAAFYGNEEEVGKAIRDSGIPREEIFVTTKLWNSDHGAKKARKAFEDSFQKLDIEYIDLYLIHWPVENLRIESWKVLEEIYQEGLTKAIGVSNFTIRHLEELLTKTEIVPVVNQVEFSPFLYQKKLQEYCMKNKIWIEAYSPLTKGRMLNDSTLLEVAQKYGKSTAQILIRWALQRDTIVLPKSANPKRIAENADIFDFEISKDDMKLLDNLDRKMRTTWDPTNVP